MKIAKSKHTYYNHAYNIALSAMYTTQQKEYGKNYIYHFTRSPDMLLIYNIVLIDF